MKSTPASRGALLRGRVRIPSATESRRSNEAAATTHDNPTTRDDWRRDADRPATPSKGGERKPHPVAACMHAAVPTAKAAVPTALRRIVKDSARAMGHRPHGDGTRRRTRRAELPYAVRTVSEEWNRCAA